MPNRFLTTTVQSALLVAVLAGVSMAAAQTSAPAQQQRAAQARPAASAPTQGPQGGYIEFKNVAEIETEVKGADGKVELKRGPVATAVPGTAIIYTSTFKNISNAPASKITINNPIPANTTLVPAKAK